MAPGALESACGMAHVAISFSVWTLHIAHLSIRTGYLGCGDQSLSGQSCQGSRADTNLPLLTLGGDSLSPLGNRLLTLLGRSSLIEVRDLCGWSHSLSWTPGMNKKGKVS